MIRKSVGSVRMRRARLPLAVILAGLLAWALRTSAPPDARSEIRGPALPASPYGINHLSTTTGNLEVRVAWDGPSPNIPPISLAQSGHRVNGKIEVPNPNRPRIGDAAGIADVLVRLEGIDTSRAKEWDLPPVQVESKLAGIVVRQGNRKSAVGVVRRGDPVEFIANEEAKHAIRARGADFFTQMLFDAGKPVRRTMSHEGVVQLSCGSGYYWLRGHLLVSSHPYAGITGGKGMLKLTGVPTGNYESVAYLPNWIVTGLERDPEHIRPVRMGFAAGVERRANVTIIDGATATVTITFRPADFTPSVPSR